MPADRAGLFESLASPPGEWLWYNRFRGGHGLRYRGESERYGSLKDRSAIWYTTGWDLWDYPPHLPVKANSTTPTSIGGLKTDYAAMAEIYINSAWYIYLVKGANIYRTTGAAFGAAIDTLASGQGRQILDCTLGSAGALSQVLVWIAGPDAAVQYAVSPGTAFGGLGNPTKNAICGWNMPDNDEVWRIYIMDSSGNVYSRSTTGATAWTDPSRSIPLRGASGAIPLGFLEDPHVYYLGIGRDIYAYDESVATERWLGPYSTILSEIKGGSKYDDRFVLWDSTRIILFYPGQPYMDVSLWGDDGVPAALAGSVKSVMTLGKYLVAFWELDTGTTMVYWGRFLGGDFVWFLRSIALAGGFPLSIGCPMVMAQETYSASQRLWLCTADGANAYAYYQDYPKRSYNAGAGTGTVHEDGPLHLYTPHEDGIPLGELIDRALSFHQNCELSTDETLAVAYRTDWPVLDESNDGSWTTLSTFTDTGERAMPMPNEEGFDAIQWRFTLDRGATTTNTPRPHHMGGYITDRSREEHEESPRV